MGLKYFCREFLKMPIPSIHFNFFHINLIHMYDIVYGHYTEFAFRDTMPYFNIWPRKNRLPQSLPSYRLVCHSLRQQGVWMSFKYNQTIVLASRASGYHFGCTYTNHSLSQQGVWMSFVHPNPQKSPFRTPKIFHREFLN